MRGILALFGVALGARLVPVAQESAGVDHSIISFLAANNTTSGAAGSAPDQAELNKADKGVFVRVVFKNQSTDGKTAAAAKVFACNSGIPVGFCGGSNATNASNASLFLGHRQKVVANANNTTTGTVKKFTEIGKAFAAQVSTSTLNISEGVFDNIGVSIVPATPFLNSPDIASNADAVQTQARIVEGVNGNTQLIFRIQPSPTNKWVPETLYQQLKAAAGTASSKLRQMTSEDLWKDAEFSEVKRSEKKNPQFNKVWGICKWYEFAQKDQWKTTTKPYMVWETRNCANATTDDAKKVCKWNARKVLQKCCSYTYERKKCQQAARFFSALPPCAALTSYNTSVTKATTKIGKAEEISQASNTNKAVYQRCIDWGYNAQNCKKMFGVIHYCKDQEKCQDIGENSYSDNFFDCLVKTNTTEAMDELLPE
jgi:hypothetical protein